MLQNLMSAGFPAWMEIFLALLLDILLGDPAWFPHPVKIIGFAIRKNENFLRRFIDHHPGGERKQAERNAGIALCLSITISSMIIAWLIPFSVGSWAGAFWGSIARIIVMYFALAARGLHSAAKKVSKELERNDIHKARELLRMIVGRDTERLTKKGIARVVCESVAENTTDGVIAPLFWMGIGFSIWRTGILGPLGPLSAALVWFYKASSTLDSMVGYKNPQYIDFGRFSAKLDDILAYLPARLTSGLMIITAFVFRMQWKSAYLTVSRQHDHHESPNSGWPEATAAGALGIYLGGDAFYGGILKETPILGFDLHAPDLQDIKNITRLMWGSCILCAILAAFAPNYLIPLSVVMIVATTIGKMQGLFGNMSSGFGRRR